MAYLRLPACDMAEPRRKTQESGSDRLLVSRRDGQRLALKNLWIQLAVLAIVGASMIEQCTAFPEAATLADAAEIPSEPTLFETARLAPRRMLVLGKLFKGEGNYVSANDVVFRVIRANKRDIELAGKGNTASVEALRSGAEQLTQWDATAIKPNLLATVNAVMAFSFGESGNCANDALSWLTSNHFIGAEGHLKPFTPVYAASLVAEMLPRHANLTNVTTFAADTAFDDIARAVPQALAVMESQLKPPAAGHKSILVIAHPDQAVRASKLIEHYGYKANVPSYVGMPWEAFGCDKNGYGPSSLPRLADRATYIRHELLMRAVQVYDGDLVF